MKKMLFLGFCCVGLIVFSGCSAFRASVAPGDANTAKPMTADYDFIDMKWFGENSANLMLDSDFLKTIKDKPTFVIMGIQNRSQQHIDTQAITDTMRGIILDKGKAQFVNETQRDNLLREQGYQLANCTPETRVQIAKQTGANYMISGSLVEMKERSAREVRASRKEDVYYQLTMEITDLTSSLVVWQKQQERLRQASKPIIGW